MGVKFPFNRGSVCVTACHHTEQFGALRAADYRIALPIAHLEPGEYLFEVEAKSGAPLVRRTIRFTVGRRL